MAFVLKRAALLDKEGKSGIAAWDCKGAKDQEAGHLRLVLNAESSDEAPADDGLHDLDWLTRCLAVLMQQLVCKLMQTNQKPQLQTL